MTVDDRDGWAAQLGQALENELPAADPVFGLAPGFDLAEGFDVGAGNEARRLAGADHDALGQVQRDALEHRVQFVDHRARKGIHAFVGTVQRQDQDPVGAALGFPVEKAEAVEHRLFHTSE